MAPQHLLMHLLLLLAVLLFVCSSSGTASENPLRRLLKKRDVAAEQPKPPAVAVAPAKAKEFLATVRRPKRNIWDRSRPDVQQWIMQLVYMGYDEAALETHLSYWMDHSRTTDNMGQHHYDENSPTGHYDPSSYRYGANVNYDYY